MEEKQQVSFVKRGFYLEAVSYYLTPIFLLFTDYVAVVVSVAAAKTMRDVFSFSFGVNTPLLYISSIYEYIIFPGLFLAFIAYAQMYNKRMPFWQSAEILFKVCIYVNVLVILLSYLGGVAGEISRLFMVLLGVFSFMFLCFFRLMAKEVLTFFHLWQRPVVIIGAGKTAEILSKAFANEPGVGYKIVGLIEDHYQERPLTKEYPYLGTFDTLEEAIIRSKVRDVIIAVPGLDRQSMLALMQRVQPLIRNLTIVPDLFGVPVANIEAERFVDDRLVLLKTKNNLESPVNKCVKRMFDLIVGSCILICILPLLVVLAFCIKCDSKGPVFHIAKRIGKNNREFSCYKFRTMKPDADTILQKYLQENQAAKKEWELFAKLRGYDPRVTKVGKWMRRYSLDELPQIFNVLLGSMSLVGPRPYLPRERKDMGYYLNTISQTVPGITGLWQVSGRNEIDFQGRLKLDAWYVRNWSVWQDVVLLFKTVKVVLNRKGAY